MLNRLMLIKSYFIKTYFLFILIKPFLSVKYNFKKNIVL